MLILIPSMPRPPRRGKQRVPNSTLVKVDRQAWLAPPLGAALIVALAAAASLAQASPEVFIAASLVFSLCEGVVLAIVGFNWSRRSIAAAILAAAMTAAVAAPARWEVAILMRPGQLPPQPVDLLTDLLVSIAWGAFAGLAGATVLHRKLATLMHDDRQRTPNRPPR